MVNYKQTLASIILIGGFAYTVKSGETPKILHGSTVSTTGTTLHDETDTNYQVPAGKTFKAIGGNFLGGLVGRTYNLIQNDDLDAKASQVIKYAIGLIQDATNHELPLTHLPTFAAGKYINQYTNNASTGPHFITLLGVEY